MRTSKPPGAEGLASRRCMGEQGDLFGREPEAGQFVRRRWSGEVLERQPPATRDDRR